MRRRGDGRCGDPASNADLIIGLLSPYALLVVVQAVLLFTVTVVVGDDAPARWRPLTVGCLAGR